MVGWHHQLNGHEFGLWNFKHRIPLSGTIMNGFSQTLGSLSSQGCLQAAGAPEAVCPPSKMLANPRPLGALSPTTTQVPGLPLGESSGLSLRELGAPGLNPTGSGPPLFPQCSPFLWACSGLLPPFCPQDRVESGCGHDKEMRSRVKKRKRQALLRNANKIYNEISPHTCHNGDRKSVV